MKKCLYLFKLLFLCKVLNLKRCLNKAYSIECINNKYLVYTFYISVITYHKTIVSFKINIYGIEEFKFITWYFNFFMLFTLKYNFSP